MGIDVIPTYPAGYDGTGVTNTPQGTETRREGDDQIRVLKANINQATPNWSGAVNATHEEVNRLVGISLTDPIITFPSTTTKQIFYQNAAPPTWTIDAAVDEHSMRLTQGSGTGGQTGGVSGGTYDFSVLFANLAENDPSGAGVAGHANDESETPAHTHGSAGAHIHPLYIHTGSAGAEAAITASAYGITRQKFNSAQIMDSSGTHTHASFGGGLAHYHGVDLRVKWAACIVATKD